ncbi:hypothetical protein DV735_g5603, partial [Chaetothyriales sp. CBS 134920]
MIPYILAGLFALGAKCFPTTTPFECPPVELGSFTIDQYQLYPENADWNAAQCVVYFGVLWNASVAIYDPYADSITEILEFPGITRSASEHVGGVQWDEYTGLVSILVDSAAPWATGGADVSGDNLVIKYNPVTREYLWTANLTALTQGEYGGFQDVEHDSRGNTYVVGTYPGTIVRISKCGNEIVPWYLPETIVTTQQGYSGIQAVGDVLLANAASGQIYRFDLTQDKGEPVLVPITPNVTYLDTDAIYAPPKYGGKVLLVSSHLSGIQVLRSEDGWQTAEYLGTVPNPSSAVDAGFQVTAAVQIGSNGVYIVDESFADPWVEGETAGNRSLFPVPDITAAVESLLLQ